MAEDIQKKSGVAAEYKADRGGANLSNVAVLGIVKINVDETHSGTVQVFIPQFGGDPESSLTPVKYMSPFMGLVPANGSSGGFGDFVGNPQSYGFWAAAPDIGSTVVCIFINGDRNNGFYIGCVPPTNQHYMVPAIGASASIVPNAGEASTYGGADRLPVGELNANNPGLKKSSSPYNEPKPVHSHLATTMNQQGLIRDPIRGPITSSSMRETPSRVFGLSTKGTEIYDGGASPATIKDALKTQPKSKFKVLGRTAGHSIVMDDGTIDGKDQLVRIRTSLGHQITMSDDGQTLFITHANGQSYVELGAEGTVDVYAMNSVNIRTEGDLNFHADRDINFHAKKNIKMKADENVSVESTRQTSILAGTDWVNEAKGKLTAKAGGVMSFDSGGAADFKSGGVVSVLGSKINLNSGGPTTTPAPVKPITIGKHTDTAFSNGKGWLPQPAALDSIVSRAPAHMPWEMAGKGVDVKINKAASSPQPPAATQMVQSQAPATPTVSATPQSSSSVTGQVAPPPATTPAGQQTMPPQTQAALISQQAAQAQADKEAATSSPVQQGTTTQDQAPAVEAAAASFLPYAAVGVGAVGALASVQQAQAVPIVITETIGKAGATPMQLEMAGTIKPGSAAVIAESLKAGLPPELAIKKNMLTGEGGITSVTDVVKSPAVSVATVSKALDTAAAGLAASGAISGKEKPIAVAGLIALTSKIGVPAISNILSGKTKLSTEQGQILSGGDFAAQIGDKFKSGLKGLGTSLDSIGSNIKGLVSGKPKTDVAESAFATIEGSLSPFKAGVPNILGGAVTLPKPGSAVSMAAAQYDEAKKEQDLAREDIFKYRKDYSNSKDKDDYDKWQDAEKRYKDATTKLTASSSSFFTATNVPGTESVTTGGSGGSLFSLQNLKAAGTNAIDGVGKIASSFNSGTNALPGGLGAIAGVTTKILPSLGGIAAGSGAFALASQLGTQAGATATKMANSGSSTSSVADAGARALAASPAGAVNATLTSTFSGINNFAKSTGDALNAKFGNLSATGANISLDGAKNIASGLTKSAGSEVATLQSQLSSLGDGPGQVKLPMISTGTVDRGAITAQIGATLGNPKIPVPKYSTTPPEPPKPDTALEAKAAAAKKVQDIETELKQLDYAEQIVPQVKLRDGGFIAARAREALITKRRELEEKLAAARTEYSNTLEQG